ncbi:peptidoglycan DD-metalloendopeptidase family protein [Luteimonas vadosa]|uniref:peptidoglycan DD-metalloendopeptidase family protein n=1 Tax=Luteimonas vadosa TaxID=1165507 RepID=UPI003CD0AD40
MLERTVWEPYGAAVGKPTYSGVGYTGHVMDGGTGLTYMQQRYYDPQIGRFLSVDPVAANGNSGINFNRYKYAANNPYRFLDPDGRQERLRRDRSSMSSHTSNLFIKTIGPIDGGPAYGPKKPNGIEIRPVEGAINKRKPPTADGGFDPEGSKKLRSGGARVHHGVDVAAEPGTPVQAAGAGRVRNLNEPRGYGIYVVINHGDGLSTRYAHLSRTTRENGELVSVGDVIGYTGISGNLPPGATPHLHFEVRLNGTPLDPTNYVYYDYEE